MKSVYFAGIALQFISLTVGDLLNLSPAEQTHMKFVGDGFFVACESDGRNVQRVMWTGPDGNQITNYRARIHIEDGNSGHKGVDIFFRNITMKDRGRYTCSANVDGQEVESYFELVIFKPIDFSDTPPEQYLEEGRDSTLICNVHGEPIPKLSWKLHGKAIKSKMGKKYVQHPENPNWIVVKNASLEDKGKYVCTAVQLTQKTSDLKTFVINVKVHHKPMLSPTNDDNDQSYSYVTGVVNLTCEAVAEPHANFTWLKDGEIITPSENTEIYNTDHKSILQLNVESEDMFGDYYCKAQNRLGTLERVVTLEKGEKPPVPKMEVKESQVNAFRLSIVSENKPAMPVIGYKVEYKKAGEEWDKAGIREFDAGKPYILDGLQSDTLYALRSSGRNVAGYSDHSTDIMQKTKKPLPMKDQLSGAMSYNRFSASELTILTVIAWALIS